jgi:hypothetical protein
MSQEPRVVEWGIKTAAHQNDTVRARIIALYDIFLIELDLEIK